MMKEYKVENIRIMEDLIPITIHCKICNEAYQMIYLADTGQHDHMEK